VNSRYLGALVLIPILVLLMLGGWFLKITVLFLSVRALYEYFHVLEKKGHKPVKILGYSTWLIYFLVLFFVDNPISHLGVILSVLLAAGFVYMVFSQDASIADIGITIAGVIYTVVLFSFLVLLSEKENGQYYVYSVFIISHSPLNQFVAGIVITFIKSFILIAFIQTNKGLKLLASDLNMSSQSLCQLFISL